MSQKTKQKYLTKSTSFGNKKLTLYSLDGLTWSSRCDELEVIKERHEAQRVTFAQIKGIVKSEEEEDKDKEKDSSDENSGTDLIKDIDDEVLEEELDTKAHSAKKRAPVPTAAKKVVPIGKKSVGSKKVRVAVDNKKARPTSKVSRKPTAGRSRKAA